MPTRSHDFRFIFANVLGFQFSDNDLRLLFGVDEGGGIENALEQIGVAMTHRTAKILGQTLTEIIADYESKTGTVIPIEAEQMQGIREILDGATPSSASDSTPPS